MMPWHELLHIKMFVAFCCARIFFSRSHSPPPFLPHFVYLIKMSSNENILRRWVKKCHGREKWKSSQMHLMTCVSSFIHANEIKLQTCIWWWQASESLMWTQCKINVTNVLLHSQLYVYSIHITCGFLYVFTIEISFQAILVDPNEIAWKLWA